MKNTYCRAHRCAAFLLALLFTMTLLPVFGATVSAVEPSGSEVVFSVPEVIYLTPIDVAGYRGFTTFQWFVDSEVDPVTHEATLRTGENNTGNLYFWCSTASVSECTLTFRYLNSDGTEMTSSGKPGTDTYAHSDSYVKFTDDVICRAENSAQSEFADNRACDLDEDHSISLGITDRSLAPYLSDSTNGCFIEWKMTFVDETDGNTYVATAYSYVYKPMILPAGVAMRCYNSTGNDHWCSHLAWISGIHSVENTGNFYPKATGGDGAFLPFSSTAADGYCPSRSGLNFQFAASNVNSGDSYMDWATHNNNPKHWLSGSSNGLAQIKSIQYSSDKEFYTSNAVQDYGAIVIDRSPIASFSVDSSRYTNFNQIPNLSIGMMITDDEGAETGYYRLRNFHDKPDSLDFNDEKYPAYTNSCINGRLFNRQLDYETGSAIISTNWSTNDYADGLKYNNKWSRDFAKTGSRTGRYDLASVYLNSDSSGNSGDYASTVGHIRVAVYMNEKSAIRKAVNEVIGATEILGMRPDGRSYNYNGYSDEWKTLMETYKGASLMLTALDYVPEITVNGVTYSDPDSMARALNTALDVVLNSGTAENIPGNHFTDVPSGTWYEEAVDWAAETGVTKGTSETTFSPNENATRAQFVTMLYRMAGSPDSENTNKFSDVPAGAYYEKAVAWANGLGIVTGIGGGKFAPNQALTREQMVTMLYRLASLEETPKAYDASLLESYSDKDSISDWAKNAVRWAVEEKIMVGTDGKLNPGKNATRAEIVTVLHRWSRRG